MEDKETATIESPEKEPATAADPRVELNAEFQSAFNQAAGIELEPEEEPEETPEGEAEEPAADENEQPSDKQPSQPKSIQAILSKYGDDPQKIAEAKASSDAHARQQQRQIADLQRQLLETQDLIKQGAATVPVDGPPAANTDEELSSMLQTDPAKALAFIRNEMRSEMQSQVESLGKVTQQKAGIERVLLSTFPELSQQDSNLMQHFQRFAQEGRIPMSNTDPAKAEEDALIYTMGLKAIFDQAGVKALVSESEKAGAEKQRKKDQKARRAYGESAGGGTKPGRSKKVNLSEDEKLAAKMSGVTEEEYALFRDGETTDILGVLRKARSKKNG